jgi:hypothetical protein
LTVYASARPVTCFSHSRPWGWAPVSLLRVLSHPPEDEPFRTQGVGVCSPGRLPVGALVPQLALRTARPAAPVASDRSGSGSPIRAPRPASAAGSASVRRRLLGHRLAASPRGLPRPATTARTVMRWLRPRTGVASPACFDPRLRVTAAWGRPTGNEPHRCRSGPPCAPGPMGSRPPDQSRLPASLDRFPDSAHRLRGRFVGSSAGVPATRTRY